MYFFQEMDLVNAELEFWLWKAGLPVGDTDWNVRMSPDTPSYIESPAKVMASTRKPFISGGQVKSHEVEYDKDIVADKQEEADDTFHLLPVPFSKRQGRKNWVNEEGDDELVAYGEDCKTKHISCRADLQRDGLKSITGASDNTIVEAKPPSYTQVLAKSLRGAGAAVKGFSKSLWQACSPSRRTDPVPPESQPLIVPTAWTPTQIPECPCVCCSDIPGQAPQFNSIDLTGLNPQPSRPFPTHITYKVRELLAISNTSTRIEDLIKLLHNDPEIVVLRDNITPWGLFDYIVQLRKCDAVQYHDAKKASGMSLNELIFHLWYDYDISLNRMILIIRSYGHKISKKTLISLLESMDICSGRDLWCESTFQQSHQTGWQSLDFFNEAFCQGFEDDALKFWMAEHGYYAWSANDHVDAVAICYEFMHLDKPMGELKREISKFSSTYCHTSVLPGSGSKWW